MADQSVAEKLAAAGWGPRTQNGNYITEFYVLGDTGHFAGVANKEACFWDVKGRDMDDIDGFRLVPLTGPSELDQARQRIEELTSENKRLKRDADNLIEAIDVHEQNTKQAYEKRDALQRQLGVLTAQREQEVRDLSCSIENLEAQVRELTRERDEYRELLRRFRASVLLSPFLYKQEELVSVCNDYDAKYGSESESMLAEATEQETLVPWTAETRPRGTIWCRLMQLPYDEWIVTAWNPNGFDDPSGDTSTWDLAFRMLEWSRDGITWERCGTKGGAK